VTVRRLTPDDVLLWREVRLRMLSAEPANYGATYADWVDRPLSDWTESLRIISYVASMDGDQAVGAMGLWPQPGLAARHRATLVAVWLEPERRGSGRAAAMLEEIVALAGERGVLQIELNVHAGNERAVRFYERHGFNAFGRLPRAFLSSDGLADDVLMVRMLDA
jgi:ribosomal protein S18 acetylase RimI-like enzyme